MTKKTSLQLDAQIEAVLFFKAEPVTVSKLAKIFDVTENDIESSLKKLQEDLENRGVVIVRNGDEVMLETSPEVSSVIESLIKEDLSKDIGKAGLEVLAIVLYRGPIAKSDIDYTRGVNSSFILRNLMIRGLVEREAGRGARNSFVYKPTFELLSHLGIKNVGELPDYDQVKNEIEAIKKADAQTHGSRA